VAISATRVMHVNVNCSDLDAALAFWSGALGLEPVFRTTPELQDCSAFGLGDGQWDAWLLADPRGWEAVVVDLLEWKEPRPVRAGRGAGGRGRDEAGWGQLVVEVADFDKVVAATGALVPERPGPDGRRFAMARDPDGTAVVLLDGPGTRIATVTLAVADLGAARAFYAGVLGFAPRAEPTVHGEGGAAVTVLVLDDPRREDVFGVELVARPGVRPAAPPRTANEIGVFRMAMLTDDIDADHATLLAHGVAPLSPPTQLDMGPGLPPLRALFFPGPAGELLELIEPST
jgi:catechol 2,3-dioxygenase-like lactoylglutathione lyase family enzyme